MKDNKIINTIGMFDLLKGTAMFVVIIAHTYTLFPYSNADQMVNESSNLSGTTVEMLIGSVLVVLGSLVYAIIPSFFIICGYGFRKTGIKKGMINQFKMLMIPYIITMLIMTVFHFCMHYILYRYIKGALIETARISAGSFFGFSDTIFIGDIKVFSNGPNWFIMALFVGITVFNILINLFEAKKLFIAVICSAIIGWVLSFVKVMPWCLSQAFVSVFYIYLGYYVKKNKLYNSSINNQKKILYVFVVIIPYIVLSILGFNEDMASGKYPLGIITIILNGFFSLFVIYVFLHLNKFKGHITTFIRKIGRYSIYILCIHTIEMMGFPLYYWANKWNGNNVLGFLFFSFVRLVVIFTLCFVFIKLKKIKWVFQN